MNARELAGVNVCEACAGRGWRLGNGAQPSAWPIVCPRCFGRGRSPSLAGVARAIDEHRSTLYRLRRGTTNGRTSLRLLEKLSEFLER